ncbi:hypothetical protein [Nocardia sp. NPDC004604]|uniref:hypothetical protein n=1 Tax=Nocardia sp. NPDC004604 TaxID=3157013 RepID=UPI0033B62930
MTPSSGRSGARDVLAFRIDAIHASGGVMILASSVLVTVVPSRYSAWGMPWAGCSVARCVSLRVDGIAMPVRAEIAAADCDVLIVVTIVSPWRSASTGRWRSVSKQLGAG